MRKVYGLIFSNNFGRLKFERKLLDFGLTPVNGRWYFEIENTIEGFMPPCIINLMHSHQVAQQLDGRLFDEILFVDYAPPRDAIEIALTRIRDEDGTVFILGDEYKNWIGNDKSNRRPSISL